MKNAQILSKVLGRGEIYLKLEFLNPARTHKFRSALLIARVARFNGWESITCGTCGNFGVALAHSAKAFGLQCDIFIPTTFSGIRTSEMKQLGARVHLAGSTYEDAVSESKTFSRQSSSYDANACGQAGDLHVLSYQSIAAEINAQIRSDFVSVWVPVGNGTTLAGIHKGFVLLGSTARVFAVGSYNNNAALSSVVAGHEVELIQNSLKLSVVNEPLVNWRSSHSAEVVRAITESRGGAFEVSDEDMIEASEMLVRLEQIRVSPAAASTIAALKNFRGCAAVHVLIVTS
jgi:threonine synthase